jgi:hypothetical protein
MPLTTTGAGRYPAIVGGGGNEAETDTLVAAMSSTPDATRIGHINTLILALKNAGIWSKLDVLWITAAHDAQAARLNWKTPASFALTAVNTPTFTTDRGYKGNGSSSYLNTGWNANTNGVNYTQNSASAVFWNRTARAANDKALFGVYDGGAEINTYPRYVGDEFYGRVNDNVGALSSSANSDGLFHTDRQSSTARSAYRNGTSLGSYGSTSSAAIPSQPIYICAQYFSGSPSGFNGVDEIACAGFGASLNAEKTDLYNAIQTYMTAVGA